LINKYLEWEYGTPTDIPVSLPPIENLAAGGDISINNKPHNKYKCEGPKTLINNRQGSNMFDDGQWLGFEGDDVSAKISLAKAVDAKTVRIRFYQDTGSWIFLPESIELKAGSNDGNLKKLEEIKTDTSLFKSGFLIKEYAFQLDQSIKVFELNITNLGVCPDWHPGKGGKTWLFLDEIIVE